MPFKLFHILLVLTICRCSNIRAIIETLKAEWDPATPTTPVDASPAIRNFRRIRLSLSPLFIIENNLMRMLAPETKDPTRDVCVRAGSGWKALLQAQRRRQPAQASPKRNDNSSTGAYSMITTGTRAGLGVRRHSHTSLNSESDPSQALTAQREEILWLWRDVEVRSVLRRRGVRLEETAGL